MSSWYSMRVLKRGWKLRFIPASSPGTRGLSGAKEAAYAPKTAIANLYIEEYSFSNETRRQYT